MEIRVLKYFLEIAKYGNMTRAADALHITQPSLSKQMKLLEEELGQKLFIRGKHEVRLSDAGNNLLFKAQEIVRLSDLTILEFNADKTIKGEISTAFVDRVFTPKMAKLIEAFKRQYPRIRYKFYCGCIDYVNELYRKKRVDIVLSFFPAQPKTRFVDLNNTKPIGLVMKKGHTLSKNSVITAEMISKSQIINPIGTLYDSTGSLISIDAVPEQVFAQVQEPLDFLFMIKSTEALMFCIEPPFEIMEQNDLVFRPIYKNYFASLYFVQQEGTETNKAVNAFMDFLESYY